MNEYIQEKKIEDLLTRELDVLENAISDDNKALAICSREEIWKLILRLGQQYYNRGVEDALKSVPTKVVNGKLREEKWKHKFGQSEINAYNLHRKQTIDNISKLLTNK